MYQPTRSRTRSRTHSRNPVAIHDRPLLIRKSIAILQKGRIVGDILPSCVVSIVIPTFPEANHPLIKSLAHYSDPELLTLFQRHSDAGQYFTAIFCRYSSMVYTLIWHSARSPVQADYLFATTWRHIFYELSGLDLRSATGETILTLQAWLLNITAICINQADLPAVETIHYSLKEAPPPLWCYIEQALDRIPPVLRLIVLMAQTFGWSETRISAYLQAEGEGMSAAEVRVRLQEGYQLLEENLPEDIRTIYLVAEQWAGDRAAMV